ncbi:hypothetical protein MA16_Dca022109 [Dendrobium catenatum]|uniref:Uncharacterized protein n=1 Tax=Dendrobium catenatum TaxID=906689 RepID=A0A2I0WI16_9ASPA|nr:hypothetical protein MA16_Dca022109 [Dendrobium catenatum]
MSDERCTIKGFNISRPFNRSLFDPDLTPIYELCHSRKTINRALILHKRRREEKKEENQLLLDHRQSSFRRLNMSEFCQIFGRRWNSSKLYNFVSI